LNGFQAGIVTDEEFQSLIIDPYQSIETISWNNPDDDPVPPYCNTNTPNPWCSNYKYPSSSHKLTDGGELETLAPSGRYYFFVCNYYYNKELHLSFAFGSDASDSVFFLHRALVLATFVFWFL
jgi:hypothetical protein